MGTEEFWVPAVIGALGTSAEVVNQKQANNREQNSEIAALEHQKQYEDQATSAARTATQQVAKDSPQAIAAQATGDYVSTLRKNAAGSTQGGSTKDGTQTFGASTSSLAPTSGASSRYNADAGAAQKEAQSYGDTYAKEMGNIDAATRMRQNEGLGMQDLSTRLNTLGAQSFGTNFVDQLRAQTQGQTNPWVSLFSGLARNAAGAYATNVGGGKPPPGRVPPGSAYIGDQTGATGSYA